MAVTVDSMIAYIRSQIDEDNIANIDDVRDILPAIDKAQRACADILMKHWDSPLLHPTTHTLVQGDDFIKMPRDIYSQAVEMVEIKIGNVWNTLQAVSLREKNRYALDNISGIPAYWYQRTNKVYLLPKPGVQYDLTIYHARAPDAPVKSQGRITQVDTINNSITVDEIGPSLTTNINNLNSFINIWDPFSGELRCSMQIQNIKGNKITLKAVPDRDRVLTKEITGTLPAEVELDDLVSVISGACVPVLQDPWHNYVIQHAVSSLTRKLQGAADMEESILDSLRKVVEASWAGRENVARVKRSGRSLRSRDYRGIRGI